MKTTIKMLALLLFVGGAQIASARSIDKTDGKKPDLHILNNVIDIYVNSISKGQVSGIESIFDETAQFTTLNNGKIARHSKSDEIKQLGFNKGIVQQDCKTSFSIVESKGNYALVKVTMVYSNFSRENFVSLIDDGNGWKIGNVASVFTNKA